MATTTFTPSVNNFFKIGFRNTTAIVLIVLGAIFLFDSIRVNSPTTVSVVTTLGRISSIQKSGLYLKFPIISRAVSYDTTVRSIECIDSVGKNNCTSLDGGTKDLQSVKVAVQVSYRIDETKIEELYRLVQDQSTFDNVIVPSTIQEALKVSAAKYTGEELVTKRQLVKQDIETELQSRLDQFYLKVVAVNIVNFEFSQSFQNEIDKKVATQQQVLQKEQELKRVEAEAKIKITTATADAEATRIQGSALKENPQILELEKIKKWDGKLPSVVSSADQIISLPSQQK
jgi:regulator of protease activity HflC (stomatin/prohibitin superfamily)